MNRRTFTTKLLGGSAFLYLAPLTMKAPILTASSGGGPPPALPFAQIISSWSGQYWDGDPCPSPTNVPSSDLSAVTNAYNNTAPNGSSIIVAPGQRALTAPELQSAQLCMANNAPAGYGQPFPPVAYPQMPFALLILYAIIAIIIDGIVIYVAYKIYKYVTNPNK